MSKRPSLNVRVLHAPHRNRGFIAELCVTEAAIVAVGGANGEVEVMASSDGEHFHPRTPPERGLRDACEVNGAVIAVGEYGSVMRTEDGGASWREIETGLSGCLFSIAQLSDGSVWCCGDDSALGRVVGDRFEAVENAGPESSVRLAAVREAAGQRFLLGYDGVLYRFDEESPAQPVFRGEDALTDLTETVEGSLILSGDGGQLYRSTDGGETFAKVTLELDGEEIAESIEAVGCLLDGRVIAVGGGRPCCAPTTMGRRSRWWSRGRRRSRATGRCGR